MIVHLLPMKRLFYLACSLWLSLPLFAQTPKDIIQFSGIIRDVKSSSPLPFCSIYIKNTNRGTTSNLNGFFSLPAAKGDTILFQTLGYRKFKVVIPKDYEGNSMVRDITMMMDTLRLQEIVIVPLPSPNQLRQAIITLEIPEELAALAEVAFAQASLDKNTLTTNYDGAENFKTYINDFVANQYWTGQAAPIQLMNPLAWGQFIQAIKNGDFKRK